MTDMVQSAAPASSARVSDAYRWTQLAIGVAAMVMIANYQYGWTFFVPDIQKKFGWDRASIQWAFTLFVLFETWLVPIEGWFPDKRGLAAGITAAGFGAGSALTVAPIQAMIKDSGFQNTFLYFGLGQGIIVVILAFF